MNSFGHRLVFTTFGESHGAGIGVIIDGAPAGMEFDMDILNRDMDRRRPGRNRFATQRKESDSIEILSGVFQGKTTGTPIALYIANRNQKSKDYSKIKDIFRPSHADFTYFYKYGIRDYRGGGRSSARETAARVAAGAVAKMILNRLEIEVDSGISYIGDVGSEEYDFQFAKRSDIYSLSPELEEKQKSLIDEVRKEHNSIGGVAVVRARNVPIGLGEPIYYKLDAILASALMGINGVKAVEIGSGVEASKLRGSENNDQIGKSGFLSNRAGGILGGISNGEDILVKVHFKPTPSIFREQKSIDIYGNEVEFSLEGRHDPVIAVRGSVVAEAMVAFTLADMLLLNMGRRIEDLEKVYG
jgi:chorismate synthase